MTRLEATRLVVELTHFLSTREEFVAVGTRPRQARFNAARERLITALCGEEPTQPLAGRIDDTRSDR